MIGLAKWLYVKKKKLMSNLCTIYVGYFRKPLAELSAGYKNRLDTDQLQEHPVLSISTSVTLRYPMG